MNLFQNTKKHGNHLLTPGTRIILVLLFVSCCSQTTQDTTAFDPTATTPAAFMVATDATQTPSKPSLPDCTPLTTLTPALTEGPYDTPGSPERTSLLEDDLPGTRLELSGYVLTPDCRPVANAWLDFWQADANGAYDNTGYILRGHQYTDENGHYQLTTVVPGIYPGRTEHIHFKVQAPGGLVLTSQLFFPAVSQNDADSIFDPALLINILEQDDNTVEATYNFIVSP
jgi:protocatechuate 3,4-dioxygenase beta subunit